MKELCLAVSLVLARKLYASLYFSLAVSSMSLVRFDSPVLNFISSCVALRSFSFFSLRKNRCLDRLLFGRVVFSCRVQTESGSEIGTGRDERVEFQFCFLVSSRLPSCFSFWRRRRLGGFGPSFLFLSLSWKMGFSTP